MQAPRTITLSGAATLTDIVGIADGTAVALAPSVIGTLERAHRAADLLAARLPVYGRSTGVGANKGLMADPDGHGTRLLRSHAVDAGDALPARDVRAMLATRLNQLCSAGSGIEPRVLPALAAMLNADALPQVRRYGGIGTGDLTALAGVALTLTGERPGTRPLPAMAPWSAASALAFISSSALTIGQACLAADELERLDRASAAIFALSFAGLGGNPAAYSLPAVRAASAPELDRVAARLRPLLTSSTAARRIQDPYALRQYGHTQAVVATALGRLTSRLVTLVNAAQENPLYDVAGQTVVHHGAFFQAALAAEVDATTLALAKAGTVGHARIRMMNEPAQTGLAPFLATGPAGSSGLMMVEYVAAAAVAEIRIAAQPASLQTISLSRGAEEDACYATQGVDQLRRGIGAYRILLAAELIGAVRLLRLLGPADQLPAGLHPAWSIVEVLPTDTDDRDLRGDLELADALLEPLAVAL